MLTRRPVQARWNRRTWQQLGKALNAIGFCLWLGGFYLLFEYEATRPHTSDASTGRTYALNNHGFRTYLTGGESMRLYGVLGLGAGIMITGMVVGHLGAKRDRSRRKT